MITSWRYTIKNSHQIPCNLDIDKCIKIGEEYWTLHITIINIQVSFYVGSILSTSTSLAVSTLVSSGENSPYST